MKKNLKMKSLTALSLALLLGVTSACSGGSNDKPAESATPAANADVEDDSISKPEKITLMGTTIFGSMLEQTTFQPIFDEYEARTGIKLSMTKPVHNEYYNQLALAFTSGNVPDVLEIGSSQYPEYAVQGALWDMTEAWENSELKASGVIDEAFVEGAKIDGVLYGFPMARGNGTITYVRQDWLDNLGMDIPTNYDEFVEMLRAFTEDDPDGNGIDDTYGLTAPGLINGETPYDIYLREFYQDAKPDFYNNGSEWVDGMSEPAMIDALTRMQDAYAAGYIDREVITNKTSTCREKFYNGEVGVFNYWAGNWNVTLENNLTAANPDAKIVAIPPIAGVTYIERPSVVMSIYAGAENPEGIFEHLIAYSHDGGEGQLLFTRGVEGVSYDIVDGVYTQRVDPENPDKLYEKTFYAPELSYTTFEDPFDFDSRLVTSLATFQAGSEIYPVPKSSDVAAMYLPDLIVIKNSAIADCVMGDLTPEEAIAKYESEGANMIEAILADYNS